MDPIDKFLDRLGVGCGAVDIFLIEIVLKLWEPGGRLFFQPLNENLQLAEGKRSNGTWDPMNYEMIRKKLLKIQGVVLIQNQDRDVAFRIERENHLGSKRIRWETFTPFYE